MQPAVVDRAIGRFAIAIVTFHHARSAHEQFAVGGERNFDVRYHRADRADRRLARHIRGHHRRTLGEAVTFRYLDVEAHERKRGVRVQRRAAAAEKLELRKPQRRLDLTQGQSVSEAITDSERDTDGTAGGSCAHVFAADGQGPGYDSCAHAAGGLRL